MFDYKKYKKATYVELDNFQLPKNGNLFYISSFDKFKIRIGVWENIDSNKETRGTVLLQQGHNEFIEKYFEVIDEFLKRGFNVISFDWRGQGLSGRIIKDKNKSYIESYDTHDQDLKYILNTIIKPHFQKPLIGVGHSMGGCLMLSAFYEHNNEFDLGILSCPMLGFKNEIFLKFLSSMGNFLSSSESYLIGSKPNMGKETPFNENQLTSDEFRYNRTLKMVRKNPNLRLWGVTNAFAKSVIKRLNIIRHSDLIKKIDIKLLVINSLNDEVVDSNKTLSTLKKLQNCQIKNFNNSKHEIFMEKDKERIKLWKYIDNFLSEI